MTLRFEVAYVHLCQPRRVRGEVQAQWSLDNVAAPRIPVRVRVRVADPGLRGGCGLSTRYRHGLGLWRIILASLLIASRRLPRFQETEGPDEAVGTPTSVVVVRTTHTASGFWFVRVCAEAVGSASISIAVSSRLPGARGRLLPGRPATRSVLTRLRRRLYAPLSPGRAEDDRLSSVKRTSRFGVRVPADMASIAQWQSGWHPVITTMTVRAPLLLSCAPGWSALMTFSLLMHRTACAAAV